MDRERKHFLDEPGNVRALLRVFYALCAGLLLLDIAHLRHAVHPAEALWGFYGLFGFAACTALVLAAKGLRRLVMRREDYYDDDSRD